MYKNSYRKWFFGIVQREIDLDIVEWIEFYPELALYLNYLIVRKNNFEQIKRAIKERVRALKIFSKISFMYQQATKAS